MLNRRQETVFNNPVGKCQSHAPTIAARVFDSAYKPLKFYKYPPTPAARGRCSQDFVR